MRTAVSLFDLSASSTSIPSRLVVDSSFAIDSLDDELVRTMARYELDSNDAAILIEAACASVFNIATADPDLHRAQLDFDVYAWL